MQGGKQSHEIENACVTISQHLPYEIITFYD